VFDKAVVIQPVQKELLHDLVVKRCPYCTTKGHTSQAPGVGIGKYHSILCVIRHRWNTHVHIEVKSGLKLSEPWR
jgi:hypothetical protein